MGAPAHEAATPKLRSQSSDVTELRNLFDKQKEYVNYFFENLDLDQVERFTQLLMGCKGVIIFTGVGKSGFIAQKISQTLVSTGTKSVSISPTDALHGDLGIVGEEDIIVLFSKSGSTEELLKLIPYAKAKGAYLIGVSCVKGSSLEKLCHMHVHLPLVRELCPFDMAPVTSTAIQILFGDTVAIALMQAKHLTKEEYALNHPAGRIGKRLILKVQDVMRRAEELPLCRENDSLMDSFVELSAKGCGCLLVTDDKRKLLGIFTDGDLRRALNKLGGDVLQRTVGELCHRRPRVISSDAMAVDAMRKMEKPAPITCLPVVGKDVNKSYNVVVGLVTLHDLVAAGL
ncbi:hypothetical protein CBR_g20340 [Chara braunii]|uniref:SIS domain-containing protein n=1 Tax=Chara braunii TaxID=69332 RepID=A0A388L078_CHABU|nr:hypothetical protein CBR_g20340 [Chara braunii]|eukprot:GBG75716.1 hypothetical protein CBR_g20340 [Chara braunii]